MGEREGVLRLYHPIKDEWLSTSQERVDAAEGYAAEEARARQEAEVHAAEEARARQEAETELAKLRETLERLQDAE